MFLQLLVSFLLAWYIIIKWKWRHMEKLSEQLKPALRRLPLLGHTYLFAGNSEETMKIIQKIGRIALKTGGLTPIWHIHKLYIIVADPEVAEIVLKRCLEKDSLMDIFHIVTGDGSIFTSVAKWRPRRKLLAPTFNTKNLKQYVEVFAAQSGIMVEKLKSIAGTGPSSMWKVFSTYTMDSVCGTTLDVVVKAQDNPNHPFLVALDESFQIAASRVRKLWLFNDFIFRQLPHYQTLMKHKAVVYEFVDKIVTKKRKEKEDNQQATKGYQYAMMSLKTSLTTLLRQYRVVSATAPVALPTTSLVAPLNASPVAPLRVKFDIMMRHVDNYCIGIEYRK